MAIDNTPPKLKLIVTIGVIVVVTLVGLNFVFTSYMAYMSDMAYREKLGQSHATDDLQRQHDAEKAALAKAKMPVDDALKQVAAGTRDPSITPQPSDDTGAMTGWSKLPRPLYNAQVVGAANPAVVPIATTDAGAMQLAAADAGASTAPAAGADAGAGGSMKGADAGAKPAPAPAPHH